MHATERLGKAPLGTAAALAIAVTAVSASAPLIVISAVPAIALAFWRNALAAAVLAPVVLVWRRDEVATLDKRRWGLAVAAGLALAVHFGAWIPSVQLTSVATATALVCTQPVWAVLLARVRGHRSSRATTLGVVAAVAGAAIATSADVAVSAQAVAGDLLALVGGVAGAVYMTLGERVRDAVSTTTYTALCYSVCAIALLAAATVGGVPLGGYPLTGWLVIGALTVGPQFLGHSMFNLALRRVSATTVSVVALLEVPGAALLAWWFVGQSPAAASLPGIALLLAGVAGVLSAAQRPAAG